MSEDKWYRVQRKSVLPREVAERSCELFGLSDERVVRGAEDEGSCDEVSRGGRAALLG